MVFSTLLSVGPIRKCRLLLPQGLPRHERLNFSLPGMQFCEVRSDPFFRTHAACRCIALSRPAWIAGSHGAPRLGLLPRMLAGADHRNRSTGNPLLPQLPLLFFRVEELARAFRQECRSH